MLRFVAGYQPKCRFPLPLRSLPRRLMPLTPGLLISLRWARMARRKSLHDVGNSLRSFHK